MREAPENHYGSPVYQRTAEIESRVSDGATLEERYEREADFALRASGLKIKKEDKILDLACGTGGHAIVMAEKTGAHIDARDISEPLLQRGRERQERTRLAGAVHTNINFAIGNTLDVRPSLIPHTQYKLVTILGNSFIVPPTKEANQQALSSVYEVVEPGGKIVIQWRQRERDYDPMTKEAWMQKLGVGEFARRADGSHGRFGKFAEPGEIIATLEDINRGDGFYWFDNADGSRDEEEIRTVHFSRAYFDGDGQEEALPPAEFLEYMNTKSFPALKRMLEAAGFKNVQIQHEVLSPDGVKTMVAVTAEKS